MGRGGSAIIRSVTLVGNGTDGSASGGEAIVVLNAAENRQRDQFAIARLPLKKDPNTAAARAKMDLIGEL